MASSENTRTDEARGALRPAENGAVGDGRFMGSASIRRIAVYVAVLLALVVVGWALIEGGERDLWSPTALHRGFIGPSAWSSWPR